MISPQFQREQIDKRITVITVIVVVCFVLFFIGFWYLQVIQGAYYEELARGNILKEYPVPPPRGLILDRNNRILSENRLSHNLFITPLISKDLMKTLLFISRVVGTSPEELQKTIQKEGSLKSLRPVLIYEDLSLSQLAYISARKLEYPELDIKQEARRSYRYNELFSHVIGYVGEITVQQQKQKEFAEIQSRDIVGHAGVERYYNKYLTGQAGYERKVVNSRGAELKEFKPDRKKAEAGETLKLGLDLNMQRATHQAFQENDEYGSAVALNIKTGEVMVLYSKPNFNPNDFIPRMAPAKWKGLVTDPRHPMQNRVIQNKFSPGSTFKIVMALAALQEKKIVPSTSFFCGGHQFIYSRTFRCWKAGGHGYVNLYQAIKKSCDVYFYNVGMRLDIDVIARYSNMLGLGSATSVDLYDESRGLVPSRDWKLKAKGEKWYPGETISVAIGQGPVLVTALQMASLMATVASDGVRIQPHVLSDVVVKIGDENRVPKFKKEKIEGIDGKNFETVKKALWEVVNDGGTGGKAKVPGYDVCGKTGTVQIVGFEKGGDLWKKEKERFGDHAWFVSFAPYSDPQVAVAVFVEHGGHGADAAAPVAKKIFETYFLDRKIPPYPPPDFAKNKDLQRPKTLPSNVASLNTQP